MIKIRTILAASAALTILFSPSIFAESYKSCRYWHEEYQLVDGVKVYDYNGNGIIGNGVTKGPLVIRDINGNIEPAEGIMSHAYATYQVGVNEPCPAVPPSIPGHVWVPNDDGKNQNLDYDLTYIGVKTEENEHCLAHMISITIRDNWDIE